MSSSEVMMAPQLVPCHIHALQLDHHHVLVLAVDIGRAQNRDPNLTPDLIQDRSIYAHVHDRVVADVTVDVLHVVMSLSHHAAWGFSDFHSTLMSVI